MDSASRLQPLRPQNSINTAAQDRKCNLVSVLQQTSCWDLGRYEKPVRLPDPFDGNKHRTPSFGEIWLGVGFRLISRRKRREIPCNICPELVHLTLQLKEFSGWQIAVRRRIAPMNLIVELGPPITYMIQV